MSRNRISGACSLSARSASIPSSASAQMTSSGQSLASSSLSSARSTGSSSAMTALGALIVASLFPPVYPNAVRAPSRLPRIVSRRERPRLAMRRKPALAASIRAAEERIHAAGGGIDAGFGGIRRIPATAGRGRARFFPRLGTRYGSLELGIGWKRSDERIIREQCDESHECPSVCAVVPCSCLVACGAKRRRSGARRFALSQLLPLHGLPRAGSDQEHVHRRHRRRSPEHHKRRSRDVYPV